MKRALGIVLGIVLGIISILAGTLSVKAENIEKTVIALDPGHDEKHGGAAAGGLLEHDLTLRIANYCKEELEKYSNLEVYMTRTGAECPYPETAGAGRCIAERMKAAKAAGASIYVSLHLNAQDNGTKANGAEVMHQNSNWKADIGMQGKNLAQNIQEQLVALGLSDRGIFSKDSTIGERYPDGSASDYYTAHITGKENDIPSVIVENAFITNAMDRNNFLNTEDGLKKLGVANAKAILKTLGVQTGWKYVDGYWYYYHGDNAYTGWLQEAGNWYYLNDDGVMQTGWLYIGGVWYYLSDSGAMQTGWQYVNGSWYYMNVYGAMQTGWLLVNGNWYYLHASGAMLTGWQYIDGIWYYLSHSGAMQTGWQYVNGSWYYMNVYGAMQTGWLLANGNWYYLHASGAMLTDWQYINDVWYYFYASGVWRA